MILGFDGTSPDLLEKWVGEGKLPTVGKLMEGGVYGPLRSVPTMSSPPAWTSFSTGKNPGKHGIFGFTERHFDSYGFGYVNGAHRCARTFWEILCGERTGCVVNVPMSYPVQEINGCMIAGLDAPGVDSEKVCHPRNLLEEMIAENGEYRITANLTHVLRSEGRWKEGAERLLDSMEIRYRHTSYLMDRYDWDLFTVVFGETDNVHHFYWKFFDPSHPAYDPAEAERYGDTILKVYQRMDDIIGRLLERNPDATVMIVSDHGGAVNPRGAQLLGDWLTDLGLMRMEGQSWSDPRKVARRAFGAVGGAGYRLANRYLSSTTKLKLARRFPGMLGAVESAMKLGGIDWRRTKAFCDGAMDDIWINLAGRDPMGIVPQSEYDGLCESICSELADARDAATGKPIVDEVFRREDAYQGRQVEKAADISVRWRTDAVINGIRTRSSSESVEPVDWDWPLGNPTGGHQLNGIFIATGPAIRQGKRLEGAGIVDVAPTVLYHFGEEIPGDFDGRVLERIFKREHLEANKPRYGVETAGEAEQEDVYSEEDSEVIEQRLKDLGYL